MFEDTTSGVTLLAAGEDCVPASTGLGFAVLQPKLHTQKRIATAVQAGMHRSIAVGFHARGRTMNMRERKKSRNVSYQSFLSAEWLSPVESKSRACSFAPRSGTRLMAV